MKLGKGGGLLLIAIIVIAFGALLLVDIEALMAKEQAIVGLELVYVDGTKKTIDPSENAIASSIKGLKIIEKSTGKEVASVNYFVKILAVFEGTIQSVDYTNSNLMIAVDMNTKRTLSASAYSGTPKNNAWTQISSGNAEANELEAWGPADGNHQLNVSPTIVLKITFTDGTSVTKTADMCALWQYTKQGSSFTSLSVTVDHSPVY